MSIERTGIAAVEKIINQIGLIFREQPTDDYGIDAQIETVDDDYATGRLIAVQIKSGPSYFKKTTESGIVYSGNRKHYDYWINHSLPVIIVLYSPDNDACYWQQVNKETAKLTEKGWQIEVPFSNLLNRSESDLRALADNLTEYEKRFNAFLLAKPWMDKIVSGKKVVLKAAERITKVSGGTSFEISVFKEDGQEEQVFNRSFFGFGAKPLPQVFRELFPWANFKIDSAFYVECGKESTNRQLEAAVGAYYDSLSASSREDTSSTPSLSIDDWMEDENNIRPYQIEASEVARYQLIMELNDAAKAFLTFDGFINEAQIHPLDKNIFTRKAP